MKKKVGIAVAVAAAVALLLAAILTDSANR